MNPPESHSTPQPDPLKSPDPHASPNDPNNNPILNPQQSQQPSDHDYYQPSAQLTNGQSNLKNNTTESRIIINTIPDLMANSEIVLEYFRQTPGNQVDQLIMDDISCNVVASEVELSHVQESSDVSSPSSSPVKPLQPPIQYKLHNNKPKVIKMVQKPQPPSSTVNSHHQQQINHFQQSLSSSMSPPNFLNQNLQQQPPPPPPHPKTNFSLLTKRSPASSTSQMPTNLPPIKYKLHSYKRQRNSASISNTIDEVVAATVQDQVGLKPIKSRTSETILNSSSSSFSRPEVISPVDDDVAKPVYSSTNSAEQPKKRAKRDPFSVSTVATPVIRKPRRSAKKLLALPAPPLPQPLPKSQFAISPAIANVFVVKPKGTAAKVVTKQAKITKAKTQEQKPEQKRKPGRPKKGADEPNKPKRGRPAKSLKALPAPPSVESEESLDDADEDEDSEPKPNQGAAIITKDTLPLPPLIPNHLHLNHNQNSLSLAATPSASTSKLSAKENRQRDANVPSTAGNDRSHTSSGSPVNSAPTYELPPEANVETEIAAGPSSSLTVEQSTTASLTSNSKLLQNTRRFHVLGSPESPATATVITGQSHRIQMKVLSKPAIAATAPPTNTSALSSLSSLASSAALQQQQRRNPFELVQCQQFDADEQVPFYVRIKSDTLAIMDLHAHCLKTEVIGLLGGYYCRITKTLHIQTAEPCPSICNDSIRCEIDPVSQAIALDKLESQNFQVVGWYHSHPTFSPEPSFRDLDTQTAYQEMFKHCASSSGGGRPYVAFILSPFLKPDDRAIATKLKSSAAYQLYTPAEHGPGQGGSWAKKFFTGDKVYPYADVRQHQYRYFSSELNSVLASPYKCFWVTSSSSGSSSANVVPNGPGGSSGKVQLQGIPYEIPLKLARDEGLIPSITKKLSPMCQWIARDYPGSVVSLFKQFTRVGSVSVTYLEKIIASLSHHLQSTPYLCSDYECERIRQECIAILIAELFKNSGNSGTRKTSNSTGCSTVESHHDKPAKISS